MRARHERMEFIGDNLDTLLAIILHIFRKILARISCGAIADAFESSVTALKRAANARSREIGARPSSNRDQASPYVTEPADIIRMIQISA